MYICSIFSPIIRKAKFLEAVKMINYRTSFTCHNATKRHFVITNVLTGGNNVFWIDTSKVAGVEYVIRAELVGTSDESVLDEIADILGVRRLPADYGEVHRGQQYRLNAKDREYKARRAAR